MLRDAKPTVVATDDEDVDDDDIDDWSLLTPRHRLLLLPFSVTVCVQVLHLIVLRQDGGMSNR